MRKKILHITPHLGGGVGTVLLNWLTYKNNKNQNIVATLDYANEKAISICQKNKIELYAKANEELLFKLIKNADIVLLHFWNHPLLYDFIVRNDLPPSRLVIWAHVSGFDVPNIIGEKILNYPDKFVYTTPISKEIKDNLAIVSTGGIEHLEGVKNEEHEGFVVGYIGTVDYAKMHPKYVETLSKTKADKFVILGGNQEKEISVGADSRFIFKGKVSDIKPYISKMDVFGYLLNPKHFGTAEQAIQEALAVGVVPVVLNNKCEKSLIIHNETGLIAKNLEEYVKYINLLKEDSALLQKLRENGKKYAREHFSLENLNNSWNKVFYDLMKVQKTKKVWKSSRKIQNSYDIFLESLGSFDKIFMLKSDNDLREILKQSNWQSDSKGTPKQYYKFLKGNELERLLNLYE